MPLYNRNQQGFCGDEFWNYNLTWNTEVPDFTQCFQQSVLTLFPNVVFWMVAATSLLYRRRRLPKCCLPYTPLTITKVVLCIALVFISALEIFYGLYRRATGLNIPDVNFYASSSKIVSYVFILLIIKQNKNHGIKSSTILSLFWMICTICGVFIYWSSLVSVFLQNFSPAFTYKYVLDMVYLPLICCQLTFSAFNDNASTGKVIEKRSPFEDAPIFSFLTYHWFNELIYKGSKTLLTVTDFRPLTKRLRARYLWKRFSAAWSKAVHKTSKTPDAKPPSLSWVLMRTFWQWLAASALLQFIMDFVNFTPPLMLDLLINFVSSDEYMWRGFFYCILLFLLNIIDGLLYSFLMFYAACFAQQVKSALLSAIYRKSINLSSSTRRQYTTGKMVNLMAVDVENIHELFLHITLVFGPALKITLTIVFLWQYLGPSCLAGVVVLAVMLTGYGFISSKFNFVEEQQMLTKDNRLKNMNELLNGIKVLKLYVWEIPFMKKINDIRKEEVRWIRLFQVLYAVTVFIWCCTPFMIAIACFVTYTMVDKDNILDPTIVFVSINLLSILRFSAMELPEISAQIVKSRVSFNRLTTFLTSEEFDGNAVGHDTKPGESVTINDGVFSWDRNEDPALRSINLHVPKGSLVAVIGPVGAGKSSLLSAILGEMHKISGSISMQGKIAYAPQQPWILNQTLKQNITFISDMESQKYNTILDACCLRPDLEILPGRDNTEIGEKGVTLSGGQKHRISLARAVYNDADVYLLDDPLSAVDAHVGRHIFENVLSNTGLLRNKTRILVTHNISVLPDTDFIVTMKDGKIEETGTYNDLVEQGGVFAEFIQKHAADSGDLSEELLTSTEDMRQEESAGATEVTASTLSITKRSISSQKSRIMRAISSESTNSKHGAKLIDEEKMEVGKVKKGIYLKYLKNMNYKCFVAIAIAYIFRQAFEIGGNVWLSQWSSDKPLPDGSQDVRQRNIRIGGYAAFGISEGIAILGGALMLSVGATRASRRYHTQMLDAVIKAPMSFFDTTPLGRIVNRFGRDMDDVDSAIPMQLDWWMSCVAASIGTLIVIGTSTPLFIAFLLPIGVVYYIVQKFYMITSRQLKRLSSISNSPIYSHFTEVVNGTSSIRAYNVKHHFVKHAEEKIDINASCNFNWYCALRWLEFRLIIVGQFIVIVAAVLAVTSRATMDASIVALSLTYALTITDSLTWLIDTSTELENKSVSVERIEEYVYTKPEAPWTVSKTFPSNSWPEHGKVTLQNYSTRYREGLGLVLSNVDLAINENEKIGIVGRTGAGKSSFALALFRIIEPANGTILIDDVDISKIGIHQLRSKLTIIPQDPVLFTGSLRINLDPNGDYSDSDIWTSLTNAHLKEFASSLTEGLEHDVAEGGSNLSVGQRQLVCLARALLKKTKILILDEATAAVDVETDLLIQNTIRAEFKDYTIITIAHRLHTIMDYDRVVVMQSGKIAEVGSPSDLLQNPESLFYGMAKDAGLV